MPPKENVGQLKQRLKPVRDEQVLALENIEKLLALNIGNVRHYTDIGIDRCKAALEIDSAEGLLNYTKKQRNLTRDIAKKAKEDMELVTELSAQYIRDARNIAEKSSEQFAFSWGLPDMLGQASAFFNWFQPALATSVLSNSANKSVPDDIQ